MTRGLIIFCTMILIVTALAYGWHGVTWGIR